MKKLILVYSESKDGAYITRRDYYVNSITEAINEHKANYCTDVLNHTLLGHYEVKKGDVFTDYMLGFLLYKMVFQCVTERNQGYGGWLCPEFIRSSQHDKPAGIIPASFGDTIRMAKTIREEFKQIGIAATMEGVFASDKYNLLDYITEPGAAQ